MPLTLNVSSTFSDEDLLGIQNVIRVQVAGQHHAGALDVAGRKHHVAVGFGKHKHVSLAVNVEAVEHIDHLLGLDLVEREVLDDDDLVVVDLAGEGRLAGKSLDLLIQFEAIVAGLGAEHAGTASQQGRVDVTTTGTAGTLLTEELAGAAGEFAAFL